MLRRTLLIVVALASSGCYTYRTASVEELRPGSQFRARLSATEAERLEAILPRAVRVIEGTFVEQNGNGLLLEVPVTSELQGIRVQTLKQRVDVAPAGIVELELKELDRRRTGLVAGIGGVVVGIAVYAQLTKDSRGRTPGTGGGPNESVFAGIRIPFSWR